MTSQALSVQLNAATNPEQLYNLVLDGVSKFEKGDLNGKEFVALKLNQHLDRIAEGYTSAGKNLGEELLSTLGNLTLKIHGLSKLPLLTNQLNARRELVKSKARVEAIKTTAVVVAGSAAAAGAAYVAAPTISIFFQAAGQFVPSAATVATAAATTALGAAVGVTCAAGHALADLAGKAVFGTLASVLQKTKDPVRKTFDPKTLKQFLEARLPVGSIIEARSEPGDTNDLCDIRHHKFNPDLRSAIGLDNHRYPCMDAKSEGDLDNPFVNFITKNASEGMLETIREEARAKNPILTEANIAKLVDESSSSKGSEVEFDINGETVSQIFDDVEEDEASTNSSSVDFDPDASGLTTDDEGSDLETASEASSERETHSLDEEEMNYYAKNPEDLDGSIKSFVSQGAEPKNTEPFFKRPTVETKPEEEQSFSEWFLENRL